MTRILIVLQADLSNSIWLMIGEMFTEGCSLHVMFALDDLPKFATILLLHLHAIICNVSKFQAKFGAE